MSVAGDVSYLRPGAGAAQDVGSGCGCTAEDGMYLNYSAVVAHTDIGGAGSGVQF